MPISPEDFERILDERRELLEGRAFLEARVQASEERTKRLQRLAEIKQRFNVPQQFDPYDQSNPISTRTLLLNELSRLEQEDAEREEQRAREAELHRRHREWAALRDKELRDEAKRIRDNIAEHGSARPEHIDQYKALPPRMRVEIQKRFGGEAFVRELIAKSESGLTWQQWDSLKELSSEN